MNVSAALGILAKYHDRVDTPEALELLPVTTKMCDIHTFLSAVMQERAVLRRSRQLLKNLYKSEQLQAHEELLEWEEKRVLISDERVCYVCQRPMRNFAFVHYPNGKLGALRFRTHTDKNARTYVYTNTTLARACETSENTVRAL